MEAREWHHGCHTVLIKQMTEKRRPLCCFQNNHLENNVYDVEAIIFEYRKLSDGEYVQCDSYTKTIALPSPPYPGLTIDELSIHFPINVVTYALENNTFKVVLKNLEPANLGTDYAINKDTIKRSLFGKGWGRCHIDEQSGQPLDWEDKHRR